MGEPSPIEAIITQAQPAPPLCEFCAAQLRLNEAIAGGAVSLKPQSSSPSGSSTLCFPQVETNPTGFTFDEQTKRYRGHWLGGNSYTRHVTLPDFSELATPLNLHCKLCRTLKYLVSDNYVYHGLVGSIAATKTLLLEARYRWDASVACIPGQVACSDDEVEEKNTIERTDLDYRLSYLDVSVKSLSGYMFRKFSFPVVAAPGT